MFYLTYDNANYASCSFVKGLEFMLLTKIYEVLNEHLQEHHRRSNN